MKRHHSPDSVEESGSRAKSNQAASVSTGTMSGHEQSSEIHHEIEISVSLRSAKKAERNDPRPRSPLDEVWQQILGVSGSSQAIGNTDNPRVPDPARETSPVAELGLAAGQDAAKQGNPVGPAPTEDPRQASREGSSEENNEDEESELEDDKSELEDDEGLFGDEYEGEDGSEDFDLYEEFPWYEELDGLATLKPSIDTPTASRPETQQIGFCAAQLIRRGAMRSAFWTEMDEPTQETHDLAFDLFDRYGRLNPEFYEHDVNKGTGVWGKELDHGDILLFDILRVEAAHRRRGIGAKLVNAILEKTRKKVSDGVGFFALTRPGFLRSEFRHLNEDSVERREAQDAAEDGAVAFFRSMGFRRVGTSSWLAWTDSPGHPSRQLAIAEDWDRPDDQTANNTLSGEMQQTFQRLFDEAVEPAKCIEELTKTFPGDFEDDQWQIIDQGRNTLLHIASVSWKPEVVSFLLARIPRLAALRNINGYTALETLQAQLELVRTRRSIGNLSWITSDKFEGFSASTIKCLAALEYTTLFDLSTLSEREIEAVSAATDEEVQRSRSQLDIAGIRKALRYKYGCTCGQCIGGFMSPRMKFALLCVAETQHDLLQLFIDESGPDWVSWHEDALTYLPGPVRESLETNKSMRQGFVNMFDHFAGCLRENRMPTEAGVLRYYRDDVSEWPPVTRNYLTRGGSVAAVANAIFKRAMEQDEWAGDWSHRDVFAEDIDALVACRNDHEFGFVAGTCGYKRVRPGPRFVDMFGRELDSD